MRNSLDRRLILICLIWFFAFCAVPAYGNPVVGPMSITWPRTLFLMIPIVLIEVIYSQRRLQLRFWSAFHAIGVANVVSLVAGVPLSIVLIVLEVFLWQGAAFYLGIVLTLCLSFLLAWWVEGKWVLRYMRRNNRSDVTNPAIVWKTVRNANLLSYFFVSLVLVALLSLR